MTLKSPTLRDPKLLRSLQYFEAVARLGSISRAAREMSVSASAVSHQMHNLMLMLGEDLLTKSGRGVVLTARGFLLAERLAATLADIDLMIAEAVGPPGQLLRLAVCSSFGPAWLAPRLTGFAEAYPDVDIELRLYSQDPEQTHSVADALVTAESVKPGYDSLFLFDEMLVAVQKPTAGAIDNPAPQHLVTTDPGPDSLGADWHDFAAASGRSLDDFSSGKWMRCTHYLLALEIAKAGAGIALVPDFLASELMANGSLTYFDRLRVPSGRTYRLCFKTARAQDPAIRAIVRWLKAQTTELVLNWPKLAKAMF